MVVLVVLRFQAEAGVFIFPTISELDLGHTFSHPVATSCPIRGFIPAGA